MSRGAVFYDEWDCWVYFVGEVDGRNGPPRREEGESSAKFLNQCQNNSSHYAKELNANNRGTRGELLDAGTVYFQHLYHRLYVTNYAT